MFDDTKIIIEFHGETLYGETGSYPSTGQPYLHFTDEEGQPYLTASVALDYPPEEMEGCILIKNWSENAGILEALIQCGLVEDTGRTVPTGYVEANICKMLY